MRILPVESLLAVLFAAFFCAASPADAQQDAPDGRAGRASLFAVHSPLAVTIEAPLTTLMRERPEEEYLVGTFRYVMEDGTGQTLDLQIRARGNFRRQPKICNFPPVRLNFKKKQVEDTEFAGQDKLKLVTHCQNTRPSYEQLVLREYLAYRLLQLMTDKSFGVRLFQITYVDTERAKPMTRYGFAIEDEDDVADRIGMKRVKSGNITHADLDPRHENLINVFQYMIGNTDFSLVKGPEDDHCCHNSSLLSADGEAPYTPLPYDFDFSGLVDAPYAAANPTFKLRNVRERLYRGQCGNNDLLPDTFAQFFEKQDEIYAIIDELYMLSAKTRREVIRYLGYFFNDISKPDRITRRFIDKCNDPD